MKILIRSIVQTQLMLATMPSVQLQGYQHPPEQEQLMFAEPIYRPEPIKDAVTPEDQR